MKFVLAISMFVFLWAASVVSTHAEESQVGKSCKEHPMLSGPCFTVKGRMSLYNGTPSIRIWPKGTKRLLGVSEGRYDLPGYDNVPQSLVKQLNWDSALFADYVVCPFTEDQPGVMRLVCVESAENVSMKKR